MESTAEKIIREMGHGRIYISSDSMIALTALQSVTTMSTFTVEFPIKLKMTVQSSSFEFRDTVKSGATR